VSFSGFDPSLCDGRQLGLLRTRRERPSGRRAADDRDELTPLPLRFEFFDFNQS